MLVPVQLSEPPPDRFDDAYSHDETAIFGSRFYLRPPVPERNFLIPPPGSLPIGWEQTCEESPNKVLPAERSNSCASNGSKRPRMRGKGVWGHVRE